MTIAFIGCGRVGTSLAKYFTDKGLSVIGMNDRTASVGQDSAEFVGVPFFADRAELIAVADVIFLTLSDGAIPLVWNEIKAECSPAQLCGKTFVHCSGALSSAIFSSGDEYNLHIAAASLHPAQAFCDKYESFKALPQTVFTAEYDIPPNMPNRITQLLDMLGNRYAVIDGASKAKYHAANVMASNLMVALFSLAQQALSECGISEEVSSSLLGSLAVGNADNIRQNGVVKALTGPIDRGDTSTVAKHLQVLSGETLEIYRHLSLELVNIAKKKNPKKDYGEIMEILKVGGR